MKETGVHSLAGGLTRVSVEWISKGSKVLMRWFIFFPSPTSSLLSSLLMGAGVS